MKLPHQLVRLLALIGKRRLDCELDSEVLAHLEMAEREAIAAGMPLDEAREKVGFIKDSFYFS